MCGNCKNCLLDREFDLDDRCAFDNIIRNLDEPVKVALTFSDTVGEGEIKFNKEDKIIIVSKEESDYLCNIIDGVIGIKRLS